MYTFCVSIFTSFSCKDWLDGITTCGFFKRTYLILVTLQAIEGSEKCCFKL